MAKSNNKIEKLRKNDTTKAYSFYKDVWSVARLIPPGRVTSYGAIANYLGTGRSARMVGWALGSSFGISPPVPAHRVVNRNGLLSGKMHFSTPDLMQELLEKEGVVVEEDAVQEFEKIFWDPAKELKV